MNLSEYRTELECDSDIFGIIRLDGTLCEPRRDPDRHKISSKVAASKESVKRLHARKTRILAPHDRQLLFELDTPTLIKEKLRTAVPAGTTVVLYKTLEDYKAAFPYSSNLAWMKRELRALPDSNSHAASANASLPY